jgi:uncharacterized protein (DUF885 family)
LKAQREVATSEAGMWARPHGEDYYRWALNASTTTDMSPDQIHEMGRSELQRLHAQMDEILKGAGYTQGSVGERMQALAKDPKYKFPEGDKGRAEIMAFIQNRLEWIRSQLPRAFKTLVNPNMEVRRLPPEEEPGAPGAYGGAGSIDGKTPGRFWINLRTTDLHKASYSLADLAFHESIPGHIWQGKYTHGMPLIRQLLSFNAFSEGWGLTPNSSPTSWALMKATVGRPDICSRLPSARAGSWSTQAFTPNAGRATRACSSSST